MYKVIKRYFDIFFSFILIILLSPFLIIISISVFLIHGKPIVFKQKRPGYKERIFSMYKFRSMTNKKDQNGNLLPDSMRITKFGLLLRKSSLDELPSLFNILKGEMSFIGPRPLLIRYLPYYTHSERKRHLVKPGLTGLAQVNGRNLLSWDKRIEYDVKYVEKVSLFLDLKILFQTIVKVVSRADIVEGEKHIMKDFDVERKEKMDKEDINV